MTQTVSILGGGAWGTAVATVLAENGYKVFLWCYEKELVETITKERINSLYLPDIVLHENIYPTNDIQEAVDNSDIIFEAVPVSFLRTVLEKAKPYVTHKKVWGILSKGIEQDSLLLPANIIDDVFGFEVKKVILSGPNLAHELAQKYKSATVVASKSKELAHMVCDIVSNSYFKPYISDDIVGAQVGGALKNVIAIAMGMAIGSEFKENTKAFLFSQGLNEIGFIAKKLGGKRETVCGLSGLGDLTLSSLSCAARNCSIGIKIGSGTDLGEIRKKMLVLPEGINTVQSINSLIKKHDWDLPLCKGIYEILFDGKTLEQVVDEIMNAPISVEF
jgi:glycerol-3-phosphate dehydrogenase (NAD(P)+)